MSSDDTEYYRISIDFSLTQEEWNREGFLESIFEQVTEAVLPILDEDHPEDAPCVREWFMMGAKVTDEWKQDMQVSEDAVVEKFREALHDDSLEEFMKTLHFKDYPRDTTEGE